MSTFVPAGLPRIGDRVATADVIGQVATLRSIGPGRWAAGIKPDDAPDGMVVIEIGPGGAGADGDLTAGPAVDIAMAAGLARDVLAGKVPPMPVNTIIKTLALGLIAVVTGADKPVPPAPTIPHSDRLAIGGTITTRN